MIMVRLGRSAIAAAAVVAASAATFAVAAGYPDHPVQFIVPFNPGGGADASQRTFNRYAQQIVGQSLVVVNKPGAGGTRGWAEFVHMKPDGYTLAIATPPFNVIPALVRPKQTGYKLDQFTNICIYAVVPDVLLVREDSQFKTLADLVKYAKAHPQKIKAANTGTLGADFMTTLLIEKGTGTEFTQIPFTGGSQALEGTLAGTTDVMIASTLFAVAQKGKLRTLAIASSKRSPELPDVPTFKELGYDVVSDRYRVLAGPPGLPENIVKFWDGVCHKVSEIPEFQKAMKKIGQPPAYVDTAKADAAIKDMTGHMQELVDKYHLAK
jgi:putative tricarboxylic transport membrane protein